jgi:hypothetical protein
MITVPEQLPNVLDLPVGESGQELVGHGGVHVLLPSWWDGSPLLGGRCGRAWPVGVS